MNFVIPFIPSIAGILMYLGFRGCEDHPGEAVFMGCLMFVVVTWVIIMYNDDDYQESQEARRR